MKITGNSGINNTTLRNGNGFLLFQKKNYEVLRFHVNNFSFFVISASPFSSSALQ